MTPQLSIIIPTLNEARSVGATVGAARRAGAGVEVIVADGGSTDGTLEAARAAGAQVVSAPRGRGPQMHAGAGLAQGRVFWFLHADTLAPEGAGDLIIRALEDPGTVGGNFSVCFDGAERSARFLTWLYPRLRRLGLCYGDSGIFVRREAYERAGGFKAFPIFEDLDLVRALRRQGRFAHLQATVVTSSRRFEGRSFALTFARWSCLQALYWLGADPRTLGRLYAPIRGARARE